MTDARSTLAVSLIGTDPRTYTALVVTGPTPPRALELLGGVTSDQLLSGPVASPAAAAAMLAGLWLWHDALHECHLIAQKSPADLAAAAAARLPLKTAGSPRGDGEAHARDMTATLAFWHAIMHRREGDFSNSKYWYRSAGRHPALAALAQEAAAIVHPMPADKTLLKLLSGGWDPAAFVDLAELLHGNRDDPRTAMAVALQKAEWRVLFEYCTRAAG